MAVPAFKRSWQFMVNQFADAPFAASGDAARGQNGDLLIALKNCILGTYSADNWYTSTGSVIPLSAVTTGWSVDGSSDGAGNFGNGDGVDRWVDYDDVIFANPGTNHSWFTMKNNAFGTDFTLVFDCRVTNNSATGLDVVVMPTGYTSAGTATARPSATNERTVLASGTAWGSTNNYQFPIGKFHFMADAEGKHFRWFVTRGAQGYLVKMFNLEVPDLVEGSTWADPWVSLFRGVGSTYPTAEDGEIRSTQLWVQPYWLSRISGNDCTFYTAMDTANTFLYDPTLTSVNALTGNRPVGGLGLQSPTAATFGYQANPVDMWITQSAFNEAAPSTLLHDGSSFPNDYTFQLVKAGGVAVPWPLDIVPAFGGGY